MSQNNETDQVNLANEPDNKDLSAALQTEKMRELENKMSIIEKKIEEIKMQNIKNKIDEKVSKEEIDNLYQETLLIYEEFGKKLKKRVNEKFVETFDEVALRIYESEIKRQQLEDKKYELEQTLSEFKKALEDDIKRLEDLDNKISYYKSENEFITKNYEDLSIKNSQLGRVLIQQQNLVEEQNNKMNELRGVIGKLTEVRVILNKYFTSHFDNFTAKEKEIINSVNNFRITNPEKYTKAMNELLTSKDYGLNNIEPHQLSQSNLKKQSLKNTNESINL